MHTLCLHTISIIRYIFVSLQKRLDKELFNMDNLITQNTSLIADEYVYFPPRSEKIEILVNALRLVSSDKDIKIKDLYIPDNCEKYGFSEGYHNLGQLLHFLADMLEE